MNTTTVPPEVRTFIEEVRGQLADLDADELREITDGLEADLSELVDDQGIGALGDPVDYALELRAAAGLSAQVRVRARAPIGVRVHVLLDAAGARWQRLLDAAPGDPRGLLESLQPVWWVARAWLAVQVGALAAGSWTLTVVPGEDVQGAALLLVAVVLSVQLGRGRLVPGDRMRRNAFLRVLLLGLNVFALAMIPGVANGLEHGHDAARGRAFEDGFRNAVQGMQGEEPKAGLYANGHWVSQIYPYDAQGHPLVGVQLYDQTGKPINVITQTECVYLDSGRGEADYEHGRVYYPWTDGAAQKKNVFPVPSKVQDANTPDPDPMAFQGKDKPSVGQFPFVTVPRVSLPGLLTSTGVTPKGAVVPGARPDTPVNPVDEGC